MFSKWLTILALPVLLGGCGMFDLFDDVDTDRQRLRADVREALEELNVERTTDRREYIAAQIERALGKRVGEMDRLATVEKSLQELEADLDAMPTATGGGDDVRSAAMTAEIDRILEENDRLTEEIAKLLEETVQREAAANARFERLETRTRQIRWPNEGGAQRGLHLASYKSHEAALRGWEVLSQRHGEVMTGMNPVFIEVGTVAGHFVRVMVGVGQPEARLTRLRDGVRNAGDYAMIMAVPGAARAGATPRAPTRNVLPTLRVPGS
ncbi:MAG: hypothetical protein HOL85_21250 [Rhodospirillaceae bacterium]|jgi:DNA repair exonuclease SbcCD ATPase subunit|nr:hypothetical protein [Rhodospirillaceae bacterium]MBT6140204.1 hypothetical protein [Rhodospirillaceae bacterium]